MKPRNTRDYVQQEDVARFGWRGPAKFCGRCQEWWPLTAEFFTARTKGKKRGKWESWCRACMVEWHRQRRGSKRENMTARLREAEEMVA